MWKIWKMVMFMMTSNNTTWAGLDLSSLFLVFGKPARWFVAVLMFCVPTTNGVGLDDELDRQIDVSLRKAAAWLANNQQPNGAWTTPQHGDSTAATSLAVMALLAAGHAPEEGPYGRNLSRGVAWVIGQQNTNGLLVGENRSHGPMYSHGIATLMLAEVAGMVSGDLAEQCQVSLEKAVRLIIDSQNQPKAAQHDGGWRYQPNSTDSDLSVTAWQLLALRAAKDIGCDIPSRNIDRAIAYIKRLAVKRGGGFGYMGSHGATITRAGCGIVALEVCGDHRGKESLAAANMILTRPLTSDVDYFYYASYYCTVGMYKVGGDEWQAARPALYQTILQKQKFNGNWQPVKGGETKSGGDVYATAMAMLAMAIEYGYLPIYQR